MLLFSSLPLHIFLKINDSHKNRRSYSVVVVVVVLYYYTFSSIKHALFK